MTLSYILSAYESLIKTNKMNQNSKIDDISVKESNFKDKTFSEFLDDFKASMKRAFHGEQTIDEFCSTRGIPDAVLTELMSTNPLALTIPRQFGGFGGTVKQNIAFISAASYESLALALTLGINNALFIQPFSKYGQDSAKPAVFDRFLNNACMGGLMITEPDFGSDALNMQTSVTQKDGKYHVQGKKHWQGLTGMADFWLLTARNKSQSGVLQRDIEMFVCDVKAPNQRVVVDEYFENLGLYQIPYGLNHLDVLLPENQRLIPETSGVKMLQDLLHRSRFQFPAMGLGFIKRMLDEAITHTKSRLISNKSLFTYDQVQSRLSRMQANFTICSAFCVKSGQVADIENDLSPLGFEANVIKSLTTDMMQESAQFLLQLVGGKGYKLNHIAGRAVVDSRPFQIFEGSNDILFHQIADAVLKMMKTAKESDLYQFLKTLTPRIADRVHDLVSFEFDPQLSQRKLVEFGQLMSRIFSMELVSEMEERGFRKDLIDNALILLRQDVSMILNTFRFDNKTLVVEGYESDSYWFNY